MLRSICSAWILAVLCVTFTLVDASPELMQQLVKEYRVNTRKRLSPDGPCRPDNLAVRKEWYASPLLLPPLHLLQDHEMVNVLLRGTGAT